MGLIQKVRGILPENPTLLEKVALGLTVAPIVGTALVGVPLLAGCLIYRHLKREEAPKEVVSELPSPPAEEDESDSE